MDRRQESRRDFDENVEGMSSGDAKKCEELQSPSSTAHSCLPLQDINSKNVREYLSSIENAQKRWVEEAKSWPVQDDIQNAQLQWLKEFSTTGTKFLTSTPQPKKKTTQYTLPFSPPRSSADIDPRRGVCVYKPGATTDEVLEFVNEKGYTVKVARIEEPETVPAFKKHLPSQQSKPTYEERSKQDTFSRLADSESKNAKDSPPRKRYITVRKKLERLKPEAPQGDEERQKSSTSPETKTDEKREATREYILRKRLERERELEEERKQEAKALAEKKARLERLKETQQRLIRNALKKQPQVLNDAREEAFEHGGNREHEDAYLWKPSSDSYVPESLNPKSMKSRTLRRKTPPKGVTDDSSNYRRKISGEMKLLDDAVMNLEVPIAELLLNKDVSTKQLLEFLEEGNFPHSSNSFDGRSGVSHHSECISPTKRLSHSSPGSTSLPSAISSKLSDSKSPKASCMEISKPSIVSPRPFHSDSKPSSTVSPRFSVATSQDPPTMPSSPPSVIPDYKKKHKQRISRSCSENSLSSSSKENQGRKPENEGKYPQCQQIPPLSEISPGMADIARPYNLVMAVTNKRAVLEQLKKDALKKGAKDSYKANEKLQIQLNRKTSDKRKELKVKNLSEKGVQCKVETDRLWPRIECSLNTQRPYSLDPSDIQSDCLTKPDTALVPVRTSDPYLYGPQRGSITTRSPPGSDVADNLHPCNVASAFSNVPRIEDSLISGMTVNGKGRPSTDPVPVDPLNVPEELNLFSRISDMNLTAEKMFTDRNDIRNAFDQSSVNVPPNCGLNSGTKELATDNVDCIDIYFKSANTPALEEPTFVQEVNEICRDSRIEKEIRKLDSFNESIASVIEKNKTVLSQNDTNVKSSNEESFILEKTGTSSTINNDLNFEFSQSTTLRGSHSSSSFDLGSEDISGASIAKFSLNMFTELLKDEDLRSAHQASIFKMKESTITEKTKAEIAFLELEKKKLKQAGNEEGIRNIRKKIRGLIIKLEHDLDELHKLRRLERNSYRKRRQRLMDKINFIKMQLKGQSLETQNKVPKDTPNVTNTGVELKKTHVTDRRGSEMRSFLERKKKELEHRELALAERLAELENISSWKQRLEDGEKKIQELEARLKMSTLQGGHKEGESQGVVERGTSPLRLMSDESQGERQKAEGSYSDTFDQASSSSTHDRLEGKDARKMMAIKVPLSPRITLKRRHSSGSDESLLFSQTETQSEASDMEVRVLALQQQLKQRKAKLEVLHREYKKSQRERLIAKEQSLLSQIQAYDLYIDQVRKELEKEKEGSNVKVVKPLIKQPKLVGERRKSDTWLVQDKDKHEPVKSSLHSSFLVSGTGGCLASPTKENLKASEKKGNDFNLDTKSLERLSLKSKFPLNSSFSDPNLLEGIGEPVKASHSSTESCESDVEKTKLVSDSSGIESNKISGKPTLHSLPVDVSHKSLLLSSSGRTENASRNDEANAAEPHVVPCDIDLEPEDSEENTLTQDSIVPKASEAMVDSEQGKVVEEIPQKNYENFYKAKTNISEEINISINDTSHTSAPKTSVKKSEEPLESDHKETSSLFENDEQNKSESIPEVMDDKNTSNETTDEIIEARSTSDQSNGNLEINSRKQVLNKLRNTLSDTSDIESEMRNTSDNSHENSKFSITKENDKSIMQLSVNQGIKINEMSNEESVRELTYLEVSDHAIPEDVYINSSKTGGKDTSEADSIPEVRSIDGVLGVKEEEESSLKEQLSRGDSSQPILKGNTSSYGSSEIEEHVPKDTADDLSEGSFPLPLTKVMNLETVDKSIKGKLIPDVAETNSSKTGSSVEESFKFEAVNVAIECSSKESLVSEAIPSEYSNEESSEKGKGNSIILELSNKESIYSEVNSAREYSNVESIASEANTALDHNKESVVSEIISVHSKSGSSEEKSLTEVLSNKKSFISEVNSAIDNTTNETVGSEVNSSLKLSYTESVVSEVKTASDHTNKVSIVSEVNNAPVHANSESLVSEVNTALDHTNKESIVSEVISLVEQSNEEFGVSEVKSSTQVLSSKESVINSTGAEHSNTLSEQEGKENFLPEAIAEPLNKSNKESVASEVVEIVHTEVPSSYNVEVAEDLDDLVMSRETSISQGDTFEEEHSSLTAKESINNSQDRSKSIEDEATSELIEAGKSFTENLLEDDEKSPLDDSNLEDSLGDHSDLLKSFNLKSKLYRQGEEYESASESSDSFLEERSSEEDVYNVKTPLRQPQQMWTQETDLKGPGAPLIEALQREGGSAVDVVWRGIAEAAVEEATHLVISTYIKKKQEGDSGTNQKNLLEEEKEVGDNDEEWQREKLSQEQAEAEAEILRLQQLRIDKEIEALEEEEARQYFYLRAIPDKPPPPYTPRRSSLVGSVLEAAGEIWAGQSSISSTFMPGLHLREFIWDLAAELVLRVNPPPPAPIPPWVQSKRRRPKKPISTKEQLLEEVEKEAKIYLGVEEREVRENLIIRWSRKRRDHVDEILVRESQEEEWEWTDFTHDENMIKNKIAEGIIEESIRTATAALAQAFDSKFATD